MNQRLLEGTVVNEADAFAAMEAEIHELRHDLREAQFEAKRATAAVDALRAQLTPLYNAMQAVFGHLDAVPIGDARVVHPATDRTAAIWAAWKEKLGVGAGKCIEALLLHGEMNTQQLAIATKYHRNTVPQYISQLHKAGLIVKNNGRFSLKVLP